MFQAIATTFILAQDAAEPPSKSLLQYIQGGGFIGYIIIGLSVLALALAIVHFVQIRREKLAPPDVVESLRAHLRENRLDAAVQYCSQQENDCFLTRIFHNALVRCQRSPFGFLELRSALEESGHREVERLYRSTDGISVIASIAPMLGLLGTVVGMVGAFDTISATQGVAKPPQLAGSISIALITTVQGLIVAIPAHAALSYFRNRIERFASEVGEVVESLAAELEHTGGKAAPRQAGRGPAPRGAAPGVPMPTANPAEMRS